MYVSGGQEAGRLTLFTSTFGCWIHFSLLNILRNFNEFWLILRAIIFIMRRMQGVKFGAET